MAITTYSELQTAVANWLDRTDLTSRIPEFISLAELQLDRTLRARELISRATATLDEEYEALPNNFAEMQRLYITNTSPKIELTGMAPTALVQRYPATDAGRPVAYAIVGTELQFAPKPDSTSTYTIELTYFSKVSALALSDSNTTNVVLDQHPDVYLYAALLEGAKYLMDDRGIARWKPLRDEEILLANQAAQDALTGGSLVMRHGMRGIA